jgi:hypothetical protein
MAFSAAVEALIIWSRKARQKRMAVRQAQVEERP